MHFRPTSRSASNLKSSSVATTRSGLSRKFAATTPLTINVDTEALSLAPATCGSRSGRLEAVEPVTSALPKAGHHVADDAFEERTVAGCSGRSVLLRRPVEDELVHPDRPPRPNQLDECVFRAKGLLGDEAVAEEQRPTDLGRDATDLGAVAIELLASPTDDLATLLR